MRRLKLRRLARWLAVGSGFLLVAGLVLYVWGVGAIIRLVVARQYGGHAVVGAWWIDATSAGIDGVRLGETADPNSPDWLRTGRISTDVSLRGILRGRFLPTRITVEAPRVSLRFDRDGRLTTPLPFRASSGGGGRGGSASSVAIPEVVLRDAEATIAQDGRPPLVIHRAEGTLLTVAGMEEISATTDDPVWGRATVTGRFDPAFRQGSVTIRSGPGFVADVEEVKKIPFVPADVWANVRASGPVDAAVTIALDPAAKEPVHVVTHLNLKGMDATLVPLQVDTTRTTGEVTIDGAEVVVSDFRGHAINGTVRAAGGLDFAQDPPRVEIDMRLKGIDVQRTPAAWQLGELGATGTLTAHADLRATLGANIDLTGTTGRAVIRDGSVQGIPIKALNVNMRAQGGDLQFDSAASDRPVDEVALESAPAVPPPLVAGPPVGPAGALTAAPAVGGPVAAAVVASAHAQPAPRTATPHPPHKAPEPLRPIDRVYESALTALPIIRVLTGDEGFLGWSAFALSEVVEYRTSKSTTPPGSRLRLPKSISTRIELEDVDLRTILAKVERFGIRLNFPVAGRLSVKASATIPLGAFRDLKGYVIHGTASLRQASIAGLDLGNLETQLDVEDGIFNLADFRGVLVDHPSDDPLAVTAPAPPVPPRTGELPDRGFRTSIRAEVAPFGRATARFEGKRLPLGELADPFLPPSMPLAGDLTNQVTVEVDLARYLDPRAYHVEGTVESRRIAFRGAMLDRVATRFAVTDGRATVDEFAAKLAGKPLSARGDLALVPPYQYHASGRVDGWEIADLLKFVPTLPQDSGYGGRIDAVGDTSGTIVPFAIQTAGGLRVAALRLGPVPIRYVVGEWRTEKGEVVLSGLEAALFGGKISGDARFPTRFPGNKPLDLNLAIKGIDTALIGAILPEKTPSLAGIADGRVLVKMPLDLSTVDASLDLDAPELRFHPEGRYGPSIRVDALRVIAQARDRLVSYQASAASLGAKLLFTGTMPIEHNIRTSVAQAEARVVGFRLGDAWRSLGMSGGIAELDGEGAVDANLRATAFPPKLWSHGLFEMRGLRYGNRMPIGEIRGTASYSPTNWKLDGIEGSLFGGVASGEAFGLVRSNTLGESTFRFRVDRAAVPKLLAGVPALAKGSSGFGSLRATGRLDRSLQMNLDINIPSAQVLNLALSNVRLPAEVSVDPASGTGSIHARHWTGHLVGGVVEGDAVARLGTDRSFRTDLKLSGVDLEVLSRLGAISSKASGGKLSGTIHLEGPDPTNLGKVRGGFNFDLDDATLVALPFFRTLDRVTGVGQGSLFDDGDIQGQISNETINLEQLTLNGQLVQLHALGSITFRGGLNLEVLINTSQIIPDSGLAILGAVPAKLASFLSSRLLKFRVTGTAENPIVTYDPGITVGDTAAGFFAGASRSR